jgi:hypothetical protein
MNGISRVNYIHVESIIFPWHQVSARDWKISKKYATNAKERFLIIPLLEGFNA